MPENDIPQVPQPDDAVVGKEAGARMLAVACAARDAFYATLGTVDADVLAPLLNPALMGGPRWPSLRQAWRVIRRADSILIASDGLSDPFEDDDDVFVPRGWAERMLETYKHFSARGDLALITPLIPNNAYGLHRLLTEFYPEKLPGFAQRFGASGRRGH